jgi:hypothetical protein
MQEISDADYISEQGAKAEIGQMMGDKTSPYWNAAHPDHRATIDRVQMLLTRAHGAAPAYDEAGDTDPLAEAAQAATEAPADPAAYAYDHLPLGPGESLDHALIEQSRDWFHRAGVSVAEQKALSARFDAVNRMGADAKASMKAEADSALRQAWGRNYGGNLASAERLVNYLGEDFRRAIVASGVNNDAHTIAALARIAKQRGF